MGTTLLIAITIFGLTNFLFWKLTHVHLENKYGKKYFNNWTSRTYYWQGAIFVSTGVTALIIFLLKWAEIITF